MSNHDDGRMADWLAYGWSQGWVGPPVCILHDGLPMSEQEDAHDENAYDDGHPCMHILRLYEGPDHAAAVAANHSPTVWRATEQFGTEPSTDTHPKPNTEENPA